MKSIFGTIFFFTMIICIASADRLPNQTPENQVFVIDTMIDATGSVETSEKMDWMIVSPSIIHDYWLGWNQVIALSQYRDSILTNGGKLSSNQNWDFDSRNKPSGLYNIESEKVLTFASTEGAHMTGEEEFLIDNAGVEKQDTDNIRCVFSTSPDNWLPPFCDIVSAKSNLINMNSAQISTKGQIRAVAKTDDIPAELTYLIAVTPDTNSGSGYAEGTVKTTYAGSIMEGRGNGRYPVWFENPEPWNGYLGQYLYPYFTSKESTWKDSSEVTGGIRNFQKRFDYKSGFKV